MNKSSDKQTEEVSSPVDLDLLPDNHFRTFAEDLIKRHAFHTDLAKDLNVRYKRLSPFLLLFIPVYSAVLSFLASGIVKSSIYLGLLSLILTIATIVNSTVKPDEKFVTLSNVLVKLKDWEADFALGLGAIDLNDREALKTFLTRKNAELSEIGSSMAESYLPQKNT